MKALVLSQITEEYLIKMTHLCELTKAGACINEPECSSSDFKKLILDTNPEILVVDSTPATEEILRAGKNLQLVICTRGNPANVDKAYLDKKEIPLTTTPARNANGVAEFTLGLIIISLRKIFQAAISVRDGKTSLDKSPEEINTNQDDVIWSHPDLKMVPYDCFKGKEMATSVLGLIGLGSIGRLVAEKASLMGMKVLAYDPYLPEEAWNDLPVESVSLEKLAHESDIISLHAKSSTETEHIINRDFLKMMKKTACLINTSRGSLIESSALIEALKEGVINGAALDVFEYEPLSVQDELLLQENCIVTPHIGGASTDVAVHHSRMAWETVKAFVKGTALPYRAR